MDETQFISTSSLSHEIFYLLLTFGLPSQNTYSQCLCVGIPTTAVLLRKHERLGILHASFCHCACRHVESWKLKKLRSFTSLLGQRMDPPTMCPTLTCWHAASEIGPSWRPGRHGLYIDKLGNDGVLSDFQSVTEIVKDRPPVN
jgi:hypothetical protein